MYCLLWFFYLHKLLLPQLLSLLKLAGIFTPILICQMSHIITYVYVLRSVHLFLIGFACLSVFCVHACACCLRYRGREWAAACPSPPAEAELVTVYWLGNIRCLRGVCSRWSKLAEWLWQTHSVHCCSKVNNKLSQSVFSFFFFFSP